MGTPFANDQLGSGASVGRVLTALDAITRSWQDNPAPDYSDGGEAGGAARTLGNTDAFSLAFLTNNVERVQIATDGRVTFPFGIRVAALGLDRDSSNILTVGGVTATGIDLSRVGATTRVKGILAVDGLNTEFNADATITNEDPALIITGGTGAAIVSTDFTQDSSADRIYVTTRLSSIAIGNTERSTELVIGPLFEVDNINDDVDATLRFRGHTASLAVESFREATISLNAGLGRMQYNAASLGGAPKHQFQIAGVDILNLESNLIELRKNTRTIDNVSFNVGTSDDFSITHSSATNDTTLSQNNANGDLIIDNTNASGKHFFKINGTDVVKMGLSTIEILKSVDMPDNIKLRLGGGRDLILEHVSSTKASQITQDFVEGDLIIINNGTGAVSGGATIIRLGTDTITTKFEVQNNSEAALFRVLGNGNVGIGTASEFGGGTKVIGLANAAVVPSTNPAGGGVIYSEAGALKWRGSSGTITTIAAA